jgi:hypothetical protein
MLVEIIQTSNNLKIQGFSLFSYKNHIYIWGGSGPEEVRKPPFSSTTACGVLLERSFRI